MCVVWILPGHKAKNTNRWPSAKHSRRTSHGCRIPTLPSVAAIGRMRWRRCTLNFRSVVTISFRSGVLLQPQYLRGSSFSHELLNFLGNHDDRPRTQNVARLISKQPVFFLARRTGNARAVRAVSRRDGRRNVSHNLQLERRTHASDSMQQASYSAGCQRRIVSERRTHNRHGCSLRKVGHVSYTIC